MRRGAGGRLRLLSALVGGALVVGALAPALAIADIPRFDLPKPKPRPKPKPKPKPEPEDKADAEPAPPAVVAPGAIGAGPADAGGGDAVAPAPADASAGADADADANAADEAAAVGEPEAEPAPAEAPTPVDEDAAAGAALLPPPAPVPQDSASEASADDPPTPASDAPVVVTTKISPDPSSVGDLLVMEVIAAYPAGYRVNLPIGVDFAPLHLVSIDEGEPESTGQGFRKVFKVTLQHFDVGEAKVPGFPLTYVGADGQVETVKVAPRSFTVESLLANEADPQRRGEDPPVSLEYPNTTAEIIIYSAAVAMLAGFLLALLWRRLASRPREVLGPPPVPPHERALTALSELEGAGLLETGLVQDYYLELTEIAKGYLEGRFGVEALDRTTDEIRRELKRRADAIAPLQPSDVIDFLEGCDLVKFARFDPDVDEARGALAQVRTMVEETKPKDAPPPAAAPATGDAKAEGATSEAASDPAAPASAAESTNMSEGTSSEGAAEAPAAPAPAADEEAKS